MFTTTITARSRRLLAVAAGVLFALSLAFGATQAQAQQYCGTAADAAPNSSNIVSFKAATQCLLNNERVARGLGKLSVNWTLDSTAQGHTNDMVTNRFFSHTGSNGSTPTQRMTPYWSGWSSWNTAENIYWGSGSYSTPRRAVTWWMNSTGHRANILNPVFREIGIGISPRTPGGVAGGTYTTNHGRRA